LRFGSVILCDTVNIAFIRNPGLFYRVFGAIIFGGMHVGRTGSSAPDFTKGRRAATRLFSIIERKPLIDAHTEEGQKPVMYLYWDTG
jgi:hypothetical protein